MTKAERNPFKLLAVVQSGRMEWRAVCEIVVELLLAGSRSEAHGRVTNNSDANWTEARQSLDIEAPHLYDLVVTLFLNKQALHEYRTRVGFREARFELEGLFLNSRRVQLFGLSRHELYPYVGRAMPSRVLRKDAEILRREFNCDTVRCSHYPQSDAFLDACDELGLLVWEEIPGWQYIGDEAWQELAIRDVKEMVRRDRNHPSIVIWRVRINESPNNPTLYRRTKEAARILDDSRPTSGSMVSRSTPNILQQQAKFDDFLAEFKGERPHEALHMKCPAEIYTARHRNQREVQELSGPVSDLNFSSWMWYRASKMEVPQ